MDTRAVRRTVQVGLAFLLFFPSIGVVGGILREEAVTYRIKGYELQRQGDYRGASMWYQKSIALDPSYPTPHNDLGVVLEQQRRFEDAKAAYQKALSMNPYYLEAHGNLAILYERMGEEEKAVYHWLKRYQLGDPSDPWTARAEERLVAFGVVPSPAEIAGSPAGIAEKSYAHREVVEEALQLYDKSVEEFRTITEQHGDWP